LPRIGAPRRVPITETGYRSIREAARMEGARYGAAAAFALLGRRDLTVWSLCG